MQTVNGKAIAINGAASLSHRIEAAIITMPGVHCSSGQREAGAAMQPLLQHPLICCGQAWPDCLPRFTRFNDLAAALRAAALQLSSLGPD